MELKPTIERILERIHQVLEDGLQAYDLDHEDVNQDDDPLNEYIKQLKRIQFVAHSIKPTDMHKYNSSTDEICFTKSTARLIGGKRLQENKRKFTRRMNEKTRKQINHNNCKRDWVTMIRPGVPERILANSRKGPYKAVRQETKWTHHNPNITKYNEEYQSKQTTPILPTCHGFSHRVLVQTPFENTNKSKNSLK